MFHENTELLPSSDFYDLSPVNIDPTKLTLIVLDGLFVRNQLVWVEVAREDWEWETNASSHFFEAFKTLNIAKSF